MYLNETTYHTGVTNIVESLDDGSHLLAALIFRNMCRDGASPDPLMATVKSVIFVKHGPQVDLKMAHLMAGLAIVKTAKPVRR